MMVSLLQRYRELKQEKWDYYYHFVQTSLENPYCSISRFSASNFLTDFIAHAGKIDTLTDGLEFEKAEEIILEHTISVFFLGVLIYSELPLINICQDPRDTPGYDYSSFIWFLVCLYHDLGKRIEEENVNSKIIKDVCAIESDFNIEHILRKQSVGQIPTSIFQSINAYFKYRTEVDQRVDHGILAGIVLYDKLVKNLREKALRPDNSLWWNSGLETDYALAAATIAVHNIWFAPPNDPKVYKSQGLDKLIDHQPISCKKYPLLFLLGLVDSLDPIKAYAGNTCSSFEILNSVNIEFGRECLILSIVENSGLDLSTLYKQMKKQEIWLKIKVIKGDGSFKIKMC